MKELIENSIDSGATQIILKLKNFGLKSLEIQDNGCGISDLNLNKLGKRGSTSKLQADDLEMNELNYLGFRGEALFGLSKMS